MAKQYLKLSDIENSKANKGKKNQSKLIKSLISPVANHTSWDLNHKHSVDIALLQRKAKITKQRSAKFLRRQKLLLIVLQ